MRLKEYSRKESHRKAYVSQEGLLLVGVDVSKDKHDVCTGTRADILRRKVQVSNSRAGFDRLSDLIESDLHKTGCKRVLVAMEATGIYWYGLYHEMASRGYEVCLVSSQGVSHNRRTMPGGSSKTDRKDAYSIYDLLSQGKFFLPVKRDDQLQASYRLMRRHASLEKRITRIRNQMRGTLHMAFPELQEELGKITMPTALRFLRSNPTPASILRQGRSRFLERWKPRRRCGQWKRDRFERIYELAKTSIGLKDPLRMTEYEIREQAEDLADAVAKSKAWKDKAISLLEGRADFKHLLQLPRMGKATVTAVLTATGGADEFSHGKQFVKLAGIDVREFQSGSSVHGRAHISRAGSAYLRHWMYFYSVQLVGHDAYFKAYFERKKKASPGPGSGKRALVAVADKMLRIIYRMLVTREDYSPDVHQRLEERYRLSQAA